MKNVCKTKFPTIRFLPNFLPFLKMMTISGPTYHIQLVLIRTNQTDLSISLTLSHNAFIGLPKIENDATVWVHFVVIISQQRSAAWQIFLFCKFLSHFRGRGPHACETRPPNTPRIAVLTRALCSLRVLFQIVSLSLHDDSLSVTQQRLGRSSFAGFVDVFEALFYLHSFLFMVKCRYFIYCYSTATLCVSNMLWAKN